MSDSDSLGHVNQKAMLFCNFLQNNFEVTTLEVALQVDAEFHFFEGQAVEWSEEQSLQCNCQCQPFCKWVCCYYGLLCTMVPRSASLSQA